MDTRTYYLKIVTGLFFLLFFGVECIIAQTVNRGPYLQSGTTNSIILKWRVTSSTNSKVWYGSSPSNLNSNIYLAGSRTNHEILLPGLNSITTYYYAVGNRNGQMAGADSNHYFKTSPNSSTTQIIRTWVHGDSGTKDDEQRSVRDSYYNYIGNEHIDQVFLPGDNAYSDGTQQDYQLTWFENMYEDRIINSTMWSTFGNHDAVSASSSSETGVYDV